MKSLSVKIRSPLKYFGGKSYLARRFIDLFPDHEKFVEPYFGGGSITLNKPPALREVAGDLNPDLINFWITLQEQGEEVESWLREIEYSEEIFQLARGFMTSPARCYAADLARAVNFLVWNRMSRGGMGKDFAWSERLRGGRPGDLNAWMTFLDELPTIRERVANVEFHCGDALDLILAQDGPGTLFYLDPPYLHETRTYTKAYAYEMATLEHERLLVLITQLQGKVFISGYPSYLYDKYLENWGQWEFEMPNHSGQGKEKQRRVECVWEKP